MIQNTDTPEQAAERRRINYTTRQNLAHAANLAERIATRMRDGATHLADVRAADGGPLLPDEYQAESAAKLLALFQRVSAFLDSYTPGAVDIPDLR